MGAAASPRTSKAGSTTGPAGPRLAPSSSKEGREYASPSLVVSLSPSCGGAGNRCDASDDACERAEKDAVGDPGALGVTRSSSIVAKLPFLSLLYAAVGDSGNEDMSDAGEGGGGGSELLHAMDGDGRRPATDSGREAEGPYRYGTTDGVRAAGGCCGEMGGPGSVHARTGVVPSRGRR